MNPVCQILHSEGEFKGVIPDGAPWVYRWGYQGMLTAIRFLQLKNSLEIHRSDFPPESEGAYEKYCEAKFSCLYGRVGKAYLRSIVQLAEDKEIAHQSELRSLIQHGDMCEKNGRISVKSSPIWLVLAIIYLLICFVGVAGMIFLILTAPISISNQFIGMGIYLGLFFGCGYAMYDCVFRPFYLANKKGPDLEFLDMSTRKNSHFRVVK